MTDASSENITSPYLSEEITLKKRTPFHAQWAIFKVKAWRILGHHPSCSRYDNHTFKIGSFNFCIGCSMIYSAYILYTILFFTAPNVFRFNHYVITILPFTGFGLAILHKLFQLKNKWLKAISRFIAGFGIGAYCAIVIEVPLWWLRVVLVFLLLAGNNLYGLSRGRNANRKKCIDCPLAEADPPCNPERNTNIRVRKLYKIIEEELEKTKPKKVEPTSEQ